LIILAVVIVYRGVKL